MSTIETHVTSAPASAGSGLAGVAEWITTTDHKRLGRMYLGVSAVTLLGSLVVAVLLGIERISPDRVFLGVGSLPELFAIERFGLGYLVLLPALVGVAVAIVPLQVGARALTFPRLAAAGFWTWLIGAVLAIVALVNDGGPAGGNPRFVDLFILAAILTIVGLLATIGSVATSILTTRAPGMNMRRVPFFTWSVLVSSICLVIALPIIAGDLIVMYVANHYPSFGELSAAGSFTRFGDFGFTQPTTLVFAIPVLGFLADTVATATRDRLRPRGVLLTTIGLAGVAVFGAVLQLSPSLPPELLHVSFSTGLKDVLPFLLVHGLPLLGIFALIGGCLASLAAKRRIQAPAVFGILAGLLLLGGAAANLVSNIGDAHLLGTTFEEGTFLAIVFAGVLAAMGAVSYWGPKWWGRSIPAKAALPLAGLVFIGAELASLPLLVAGFADQPGLVFPSESGTIAAFDYSGPKELWNTLSTVGLALVVLAVLAFAALALRSFRKGDAAGDDPWDGQTLEWGTTSPAPADNFAAIHIVKSGEPLLDLKPRSDA